MLIGTLASYVALDLESHRMHPLVERTYTLDDYAAVLKDLASGNFMGKLVIRL